MCSQSLRCSDKQGLRGVLRLVLAKRNSSWHVRQAQGRPEKTPKIRLSASNVMFHPGEARYRVLWALARSGGLLDAWPYYFHLIAMFCGQ